MTESEWLNAKDPEAMLALVSPRLSRRQEHLLYCLIVRRVWDLLEDDALRDTVRWAESNAGGASSRNHEDGVALLGAKKSAADRGALRQWEIVRAADPDADPEAYYHTHARKTNPSAPLFQAASRAASASVQSGRDAASLAAEAVRILFDSILEAPSSDRLRETVLSAIRFQAVSNAYASLALKLKAFGDESADRDNGRNVGLRLSAAIEAVRREEDYSDARISAIHAQKERSERKALGRFLHELCGNPFRPVPFDPNWRTDTVLGLARAIDLEGGYDRLPILADALLDADCDQEALLRHCRGTEHDTVESGNHGRGCWAVERVLGREAAFFDAPPPGPPQRVRTSRRRR